VKLPGYLDPSFVPPAPSIYAQIESGVLHGTAPWAASNRVQTRLRILTMNPEAHAHLESLEEP